MLKVVKYNLNCIYIHTHTPKTSLHISLLGIEFSSRFGEHNNNNYYYYNNNNYYYYYYYYYLEKELNNIIFFINYKNSMELKTLVRVQFHYFDL